MCDCAGEPTLVVDSATGDEICTSCGVVVDRVLGVSTWDGAPCGPVGVAAPFSPVAFPGVSRRVAAVAAAPVVADPDRAAKRCLRETCGRLHASVPGVVHAAAEGMYDDYVAATRPPTRSRPTAAAACLYFAFRLERCDRELRVVADAAGLRRQTLTSAVKTVKDFLLATEPYAGVVRSSFGDVDALVGQYLSRLGVDEPTRKRLWRETHRVLDAGHMRDCGKKPRTVAATAICSAADALGLRLQKKDIATASGVCAQTMCIGVTA